MEGDLDRGAAQGVEAGDDLTSRLEALLARYLGARAGSEAFGKRSETWQLLEALVEGVADSEPVRRRPEQQVQGSVGRGAWAAVPWLAVVDRRLGRSPRDSTSLMFLCRADTSGLYLALTVGVGKVLAEHGRAAGRPLVRQRVEALRAEWADLQSRGFCMQEGIDLRDEGGRGREYEEAAVAWRFYPAGEVPPQAALLEDVEAALQILDGHAAANRRVDLRQDLTGPGPLLEAADRARHLGRAAFLERLGFPASRRLHLVIDGHDLDARAVVAAAYGQAYPEAGPLSPEQLEGYNDEALVEWLRGLGLEVVVEGDDRPWWRERIGHLERTHHQGKQPVAEALLTLILIGRARRHQPYQASLATLADRLTAALERFGGGAEESAEEVLLSLTRHGFWRVDLPTAAPSEPDPRAVRRGTGGVPPERWQTLVEDAAFREEVAGRLMRWFFPDRHLHAALRREVGLDPTLRPEALRSAWADLAQGLERSGLSFGGRHHEVSRAFVASLATKRFVILTGLSGSGKTQIALKFGEWLGPSQHMVVPVRPEWTGSEALLGYEDALSPVSADGRRGWAVPRPLAFLLQAARDPGRPYLLLLDEMNLAHVERYFADVLSGMESGFPTVPNLRREEDGQWRLVPGAPELLPVPKNLFLVGTVNVDETTHRFSPKVLDRANTLEFRVRTQDLALHFRKPTACAPGHPQLVTSFLDVACDEDWHLEHLPPWIDLYADRLRALHALLSRGGFEFGHRVFYEAARFAAMWAACGGDDPLHALDHQVMQKILPRIHGSRRIVGDMLLAMVGFCHDLEIAPRPPEALEALLHHDAANAALPRSFEKVVSMVRHLQAHQFTSFTA